MDLAAILTLLVAPGIVGQTTAAAGIYPTHPENAAIVAPGHWPHGYHGHYHASTPAESVLRGRADLTRAMGWYNYLTSQAMIYREQARAEATENSKRAVAAYFERRRINEEARQAKKTQPYLTQAAQSRPAPTPKPVVQLFDLATGKVAWPVGLLSDEFAADRVKIEKLLKLPAVATPADASLRSAEVRKITAQMLTDLRDRIHNLSPMQYVESRRFLSAVAGDSAVRGGNPAAHLAASQY